MDKSNYCLYPDLCGIGSDCSECQGKEISRLQSELARAREELDAARYTLSFNAAAAEQYAEERDRAREQLKVAREAIETSVTAMDDWLNTFAPEHCDEDRVKEALDRVNRAGTVAYIAHVQLKNGEALSTLDDSHD